MGFVKTWRGTSVRGARYASMVALALLLANCTPADQAKDSAKEGSETQAAAEESGSFGFSSFLAAIQKMIVGTPGSSTERRDDQGRVCTLDSFQQPDAPHFGKADILFVQDTSGSMKDEWRRVAGNIQHLMQQIPPSVDVRVAVVLAHVGQYSGKLYSGKNQPKVLSNRNMTNTQIGNSLYATFDAGIQTTDPALGEAAFYSLNDAITKRLSENQKLGFFRPDAALAVVFMSDEQEIGHPFPIQAPGLPKRCDEYWEDRFKRDYYDSQRLTIDSLVSRLKQLKGEAPLTTHALVNITAEDLFRHNDPNASCLYDSLGYGYFEMIQKTQGVLFSVQDDRTEGMIRIGRSVSDGLDLIHDFRLSKPAEKVDPVTIKASVDGSPVPHVYNGASHIVHLDNAGSFGSKIKIEHCDYYQFNWQIQDFAGVPTHDSVTLSWKTPGMDTKALVKVGLSRDDLSFRSYTINEFNASHTHLVPGLEPKTKYFFQVVANDKFTGSRTSEIIEVTTLEEPILWRIEDFGGTTTHNSATLAWKTPGEMTRAVLYAGEAADQLTQSFPLTEYKVSQEKTVTGLKPNTTYFFKVVAEDKKARKVESEVISLRTKEEPIADWQVLGLDATTTIDTAVVFWQTPGFQTNAKLRVGLSANDLSLKEIEVTEFKEAHQETVTGLEPDTLYFFQVEAVDKLGRKRISNILSKRTKPDPITWQIANLQGVPTYNTILMSWNTGSEETKAVLKVGLKRDDLSFREYRLDTAAASQQQLVEGLTELTSYFFQVVATDKKNRSLTSPVIEVKTLEEPIRWMVNDLAGVPTYNSVDLSWNTGSELTKAVVHVGKTEDNLSFKTLNVNEFKTAHALAVTGLEEMTTYYFQVTATDKRNRPVKSGVIAVKTLEEPIRWQINNLAGTTTYESANITWDTGNEETRAVLKVGLSADDLSFKQVDLTSFKKSQQAKVEGLTELTNYYFQVTAYDRRNRPVTSNILLLRTGEEPIRWSINGLAGVPTYNSVNLTWNTGTELTRATVKVGLTAADLTFKEISITELKTAHAQMVEGLTELTTYYFQVVAYDNRNRPVVSNVISVKTLEEPIRWMINDLAGVPTYNTVNLSWNTGTELTRATVKVGKSATSLTFKSYTISNYATSQVQLVDGLDELTTYYFQVTAYDKRNRPVVSPVISVKTLEEPIRWMINNLAGVPTYNTVNLSWNTGSEQTRALVKVGLTADDLTFKEIAIDGYKTSHTQLVSGLTELTTYYFQVTAFDKRNRPVVSDVISVKTLEEPIRWSINNLAGVPTYNSVNLSWNTGTELTRATVKVGLSASDLSFREYTIADAKASHTQMVDGLEELTTYYFQVTAFDNRNRPVVSNVISVKTLEEPIRWMINDLAGLPTYNTVNLSWNTGTELTRATVKVGKSATSLTFKSYTIADYAASHTQLVDGLEELTTYYFQVTAYDKRNRPVVSPVISVKTLEEPIRWMINNLAGTTTYNSATITYNTGTEDTRAVIKVGLSPTDLTLKEVPFTAYSKTHSHLIEGLNELTDYYFQVVAYDKRNRPVTSGVLQLRTLEEPIFWRIQNLGGTAEWNKANISWNTGSEQTKAVLKVGLSADDLTFQEIPVDSFSASHAQLVSGLSELTNYYFQVVATDKRNRSLTSEIFQLKTPVEPILWNINNISATPEFSSATIAWDTNGEATRAVIKLGTSSGNLNRTIDDAGLKEAHSIEVNALIPSTTYYYQITAFDGRERQRQSTVRSFTTPEQTWTVAGLDATSTANALKIIWQTQNALTNGKVRVGLSADNLTLVTATVSEFRNSHLIDITGLTPNTRYFIQVEARDQEGRRVVSNTISKVTKPAATGVVGGQLGWIDNSHLIPGKRP